MCNFRWFSSTCLTFGDIDVILIVECFLLQALQYLHKLCCHPALVVTPRHPQYDDITAGLQRAGTSLRDIQHAPKLVALQYVSAFVNFVF